jgi:hypothetical protein
MLHALWVAFIFAIMIAITHGVISLIVPRVPPALEHLESAHRELVRATPGKRAFRECLDHAYADHIPSWMKQKLAANCRAQIAERATPEYLHALQRFNEARDACFRALPGEYRCTWGGMYLPSSQ